MSWNYRVVKVVEDGEEYFAIHEVYYNKDGSIRVMTESPVHVGGDSVESLRSSLQMMSDCLSKDVLVDGEIVFVDLEAAEHSLHSDVVTCPTCQLELDSQRICPKCWGWYPATRD